jgi:gliding motility-associated-like protein
MLIVFIAMTQIMSARHIVGGDMTYECISTDGGQMTIELTLTIYRDAFQDGRNDPSPFDRAAEIGAWVGTPGNYRYLNNFFMRPADEPAAFPAVGTPIVPPPNPCFQDLGFISTDRVTYTMSVSFDIMDEPLLLAYQRCCRNNNISNLVNSGVTGSVYSLIITPESQRSCNNSPTFNTEEDIVICAGLIQTLDFSASDRDIDPLTGKADSLVYKFCQPLAAGGVEGSASGTGGLATDCDGVTPAPNRCGPEQFIAQILIGDPNVPIPGSIQQTGDPGMTINSETGIITGTPTVLGLYVLAVCVEEWRDGVLIGEVRRDFQFTVSDCLVEALPGNRGETIPEVQAQCETSDPFDSCGDLEIELRNFTEADPDDVTWKWTIDKGSEGIEIITDRWQPRVQFPGVGEFRIELIINPNEECADTCIRFIDVTDNLEAKIDDIEFNDCDDTFFEIDGTESDVPNGLFDITWDFGDGRIVEGLSTNPGILNQNIEFTTPGEKEIKLTLSNRNCSKSDSVTLDYFPIPADFTVTPTRFIGCQPAEIRFENVPAIIDDTYDIEWEFGDGGDSKDRIPTHIYEDPGNYTVELKIKSPSGCEDITLLTDFIEVLPAPKVDFEMPDIVEDLNAAVLFENRTTDGVIYEWDFGDGNSSSDFSPSHIYTQPGTYNVSLVSKLGEGQCSDTLIKELLVFPPIKPIFPNAFTPNGDGRNDEFKGIDLIEGFGNYELRIFDRYGQKVFEAFNINDSWNGRLNNQGELLPQGVYTYVARFFNVAGDKDLTRGTVLLLN